MRQAELWRRAAGIAGYVEKGPPGRHAGRWICLDCPRDWHNPPYLPFRLPIHIREHRERYPDHAFAWWCSDDLAVEHIYTTGWRWVYDPVMSHGSEVGGEVSVCTYRRVTIEWPDGRELRLVVTEDPEKPQHCSTCGMSEATFRAKTMTPHDDLGHQELYYGAKVTRGRRLSAAQAGKIRGDLLSREKDQDTFQVSLPGVLVDLGRHP